MIHLAAMFKDITLSSDELRFVIEKIVRLLNELDVQELPPLIYQLLLLSTKVGTVTCLSEVPTVPLIQLEDSLLLNADVCHIWFI